MSIRLSILNLWLRIAAKPVMRRFREPVASRREMERMASWVVREPTRLCLLPIRIAGQNALSLRASPT